VKWVKKNAKLNFDKDMTIVEKLAKINKVENLSDWMNPSSKFENSPHLLKNIDEATHRIMQAVRDNEKINVVADCKSKK
jgi:hypothetical protein